MEARSFGGPQARRLVARPLGALDRGRPRWQGRPQDQLGPQRARRDRSASGEHSPRADSMLYGSRAVWTPLGLHRRPSPDQGMPKAVTSVACLRPLAARARRPGSLGTCGDRRQGTSPAAGRATFDSAVDGRKRAPPTWPKHFVKRSATAGCRVRSACHALSVCQLQESQPFRSRKSASTRQCQVRL